MTGDVQDAVVQGDGVAARLLWTGTHDGAFLGLPGTGRQVSIVAMERGTSERPGKPRTDLSVNRPCRPAERALPPRLGGAHFLPRFLSWS